jgi:hypothetical protein
LGRIDFIYGSDKFQLFWSFLIYIIRFFMKMRNVVKYVIGATITLWSCSDEPQSVFLDIQVEDFEVSIMENPEAGYVLGFIEAEASFGDLQYELVGEDLKGAFILDPYTGELRVADPSYFDFELRQEINATCKVTAGGGSKEVQIKVALLDMESEGSVAFNDGFGLDLSNANLYLGRQVWMTQQGGYWVRFYIITDGTHVGGAPLFTAWENYENISYRITIVLETNEPSFESGGYPVLSQYISGRLARFRLEREFGQGTQYQIVVDAPVDAGTMHISGGLADKEKLAFSLNSDYIYAFSYQPYYHHLYLSGLEFKFQGIVQDVR